MSISSEERIFLDSLSDKAPWELVERFSVEPRWRPEDVNKGAETIAAFAREMGLPVELLDAKIHLSVPYEASVTIGGKQFKAKPPALSAPAVDGLTAESLYIAANPKNLRLYSRNIADVFGDSFTDWEDFRRRISGRILVTEGFGNPALTSLVQDMGAAGLVVINPGDRVHWGTSSMVWGNPGLQDLSRQPTIPVVAVNRHDGAEIREMAKAARTVTVQSRLEAGWYTQKIPVVTIPGTEEPEKFVLVHGHYDSWDVGVGDNATGDAVLLGLADGMWRNRDKLRRSVRVAWWPGHSTGRYSGSTWYADQFALELDRNCVATVNCDSPGCRWATSYHKTTCMTELHGFVSGVITDITGTPPKFIRPKRAGDASFLNIGISSYFSLSSTMPDDLLKEKGYYEVSGCGGNIAWHTEDDQMEIADRDILNTDLQIYALAAYRHATALLLPNDWRATLQEFSATLAGYAKAAGAHFDFQPLIDETQALTRRLNAFHEAAAAGKVPSDVANATILGLERILIPVNYARVGRFQQDPALACPALPALSSAAGLPDASEETAHAIVTDLRRGANEYLTALDRAAGLLERAGQ